MDKGNISWTSVLENMETRYARVYSYFRDVCTKSMSNHECTVFTFVRRIRSDRVISIGNLKFVPGSITSQGELQRTFPSQVLICLPKDYELNELSP